ncbi:hypothetical protein HDE_09624 [Halotydeus destructor]|nr:hypothetical protein HDE_09624 [Halotydeus destructor]
MCSTSGVLSQSDHLPQRNVDREVPKTKRTTTTTTEPPTSEVFEYEFSTADEEDIKDDYDGDELDYIDNDGLTDTPAPVVANSDAVIIQDSTTRITEEFADENEDPERELDLQTGEQRRRKSLNLKKRN